MQLRKEERVSFKNISLDLIEDPDPGEGTHKQKPETTPLKC